MEQETTIHFQTTHDLIDTLRAVVQDVEFALVLSLQTRLDNAQTFADFLVRTKCSWFFACGKNHSWMEDIIDQADSELMESDQMYEQHYGRKVILTIASDETLNECIKKARLMISDERTLVVAIENPKTPSAATNQRETL